MQSAKSNTDALADFAGKDAAVTSRSAPGTKSAPGQCATNDDFKVAKAIYPQAVTAANGNEKFDQTKPRDLVAAAMVTMEDREDKPQNKVNGNDIMHYIIALQAALNCSSTKEQCTHILHFCAFVELNQVHQACQNHFFYAFPPSSCFAFMSGFCLFYYLFMHHRYR